MHLLLLHIFPFVISIFRHCTVMIAATNADVEQPLQNIFAGDSRVMESQVCLNDLSLSLSLIVVTGRYWHAMRWVVLDKRQQVQVDGGGSWVPLSPCCFLASLALLVRFSIIFPHLFFYTFWWNVQVFCFTNQSIMKRWHQQKKIKQNKKHQCAPTSILKISFF